MEVKKLFSKSHIWVLQIGDTVRLGVSDHAQKKLGNIMFLNLPDAGEEVLIGQRFGDIESIKTVSDLISPVDGKVIAVNEELIDEPESINEAPYESWFIEVKVRSLEEGLMDENAYLNCKDAL